MIVAYDARSLHPSRRHLGVGVVVSNIVQRLTGKLELVGLAPGPYKAVHERIRHWPSPIRQLDIFTFELSPMLSVKHDLYWGTNHLLPQLALGRTLLTVHDLLLFKFPNDQPWTRYVRARFASSVRRAHRIVAVSQTTADNLLEFFPDVKRKTVVVYSGFQFPPGDALERRGGGSEPYVMVLGAHRPRKNLDLAIAAVARVRERGRRLRLVVTGEVHPAFRKVLKEAASFTDLVGTVSKEEVFRLLADAGALLFPSLYEGFGLPLLEAMSVGCPIIAADTPIDREICGTAATLLTTSPKAWACAIERFLDDQSLRSEVREKGFENLQRFDWDRSAAHYLQVMNEC